MAASGKTLELLLELGNPAERRTRAEQLDLALRTALLFTDADAIVVLTPASRRGERLVLHAGSTAPAVLPGPPEGSAVVDDLAGCCEPMNLHNLSEDARLVAGDRCPGVEAGPALFTPLRQRDQAPGYIACYRSWGRTRFTATDGGLMLLLAAWLGMALDGLRMASGAQRLAVTDDLTDVYNARFMKAALRREIRRAHRFSQELSLLAVGIDPLAGPDAANGRPADSVLLREVASLLAQQVRSFDLVARHGEDQFMLILPQTGVEGAMEVAERIRAAVERHAFAPAPPGAVTASLGVAAFPREGADARSLLGMVDRALARAQQRGRNCVESLIRTAA
jgi:diguanylate cyclase (GGDEF)-like protein